MKKQVLVTGGAGFIGGHLVRELLASNYAVRALDSLVPQVHGPNARRPEYLPAECELMIGDVRDRKAVVRALEDIDLVVHLAAAVGVGQSMHEMAEYSSVNTVGTAVLLEALAESPPERLVVASSMCLYGEGLYRSAAGRLIVNARRSRRQLISGDWEPRGADGEPLRPVQTPESKSPELASVYALTKYDQERLCLISGDAHHYPVVALRLFNVYGPQQALSNPCSGVLASFAARLLDDRPPMVFEDGQQMRDFVSVHDVARAFRLALERDLAGEVLNVGSGRAITINEAAHQIAHAMGRPELRPLVSGKHRGGDIRHCFPDIAAARRLLGYEPKVSFEEGLEELAAWLRDQAARDRTGIARSEQEARGFVGG